MVKLVDGDTFYVDWNQTNTRSRRKLGYCLLILRVESIPQGSGSNLVCRLGISLDRLQNGPCNSGCLSLPRDRHQRTLGLLQAEDANVNLLLIS